MKLLTKALLLCLFLATTLFAAFTYIKTTSGILPISPNNIANINILPFSVKQELGAHGSDHLSLYIGKEYPHSYYSFRSENTDFIGDDNPKEIISENGDSEVIFNLPQYKLDSMLQVCNPLETCKTFKISCPEHGPGPSTLRCFVADVPDIKNKIPNMFEVKIMHDIEYSIDSSVDSNLKVFGDEGLYEQITQTTKFKGKGITLKEESARYQFDTKSFDQNEWNYRKSKLKELADSLSNGAEIKDLDEINDYTYEPGKPNIQHSYTITWGSNVNFGDLEDYHWANLPDKNNSGAVTNWIILQATNDAPYTKVNYSEGEHYETYSVDIHVITQINN